jgi:Domain of unknown function (DUF222)
VLGELKAALDAIVAIDPDTLTDAELHHHVVEFIRHVDRLTIAAAPLVQKWDSRQVWADDGSKSPAARLARECGSSQPTTRCVVRRAKALVSMPVTAAAGVDGGLSVDKVDLLAHANTTARRAAFVAQEATLVDAIAPLRHVGAKKAVRYWCARVDAELDSDTAPVDATGRLHVSSTLYGKVVVDGVLDPVGGAIVTRELDRLIADQRRIDAESGVERTLPQLRAAALVEMARRSTGATGTSAKPLFSVLVGDDSFRHLCELSNGTVITPRHLIPWLTDACTRRSSSTGRRP